MSRAGASTTVDEALLMSTRKLGSGLKDAAHLDEALEAMVGRDRSAEIDAAYSAYDEPPIDEVDAWGDLGSFHEAAATS